MEELPYFFNVVETLDYSASPLTFPPTSNRKY